MNFRPILAISVATTFTFLVAACPAQEDNTARDMTLLAALASQNSGSGSVLNTQQTQAATAATAASNAATSASSSSGAAGGANMQAYNKMQGMNRVLASYLENGKDPVYLRTAMKKFTGDVRAARQKAELAAITIDSTSGTTPNRSYTFHGDINGYTVAATSYDVGTYNPALGSCIITYLVADLNSTKGTATFTNGTITYSGTNNSGTVGTVSTANAHWTGGADVVYAGYGTAYIDTMTYINWLKNNAASAPSVLSGTNCAAIQAYYAGFYSFLVPATIDGSMSYTNDYTYTYSADSSTGVFASSGNQTTVINSPAGLTINSDTVTMENLTYNLVYNLTQNTGTYSYTGTYTMTFTGTLNGTAMNDVVTITL